MLHLCCGESGNLSVAEFLVERGVDIHSTDNVIVVNQYIYMYRISSITSRPRL